MRLTGEEAPVLLTRDGLSPGDGSCSRILNGEVDENGHAFTVFAEFWDVNVTRSYTIFTNKQIKVIIRSFDK